MSEQGTSGWDGKAKAGNQNGKELAITKWYDGGWDFVLRAKDTLKAEKMAKACEQGVANIHIGYDQSQRNTLMTQARLTNFDLSKITTDCECDCSSFMTVCAYCSGIEVPCSGGNAPRTATMEKDFGKTNAFNVLKEKMYLTTDSYLKRGDILVKAGKHTVMVLENGSLVETIDKVTKKSVYDIAREVIAGKWGNGEQRKQKLKEAGYEYSEVQKAVNSILKK